MGQEKKYTNTVGVGLIGSTFLVNDDVAHLEQSLPWGVEASWVLNTYGETHWQQAYNYPDIGAVFNYWNFQNDELGDLFSLLAIYNFYPIRGKKHHLLIRPGFGFALTTKRFTRENNRNIAIGNTLSYMIQGGFGYSFQLEERFRLEPMLVFTHISNGAYVVPNFGMNLVSMYLTASYRIEELRPVYKKRELKAEDWKDRPRLNIVAGIGAKEIDPPLGSKYLVLSATAYLDQRVARVSAINAGIDFVYDRSREAQIDRMPNVGNLSPLTLGALLGHELFIDRLSIITQVGVYFWRDFKESTSPFFLRMGFKFYLTDKLFVNTVLNTEHFDTSDFVRYGIGVRF